MADKITKAIVMQTVVFKVTDLKKATGSGLHVAASRKADGKGKYAEFFLRVSEEGEVVFVYLDGRRVPPPSSGPRPLYIGEIGIAKKSASDRGPLLDITSTGDPGQPASVDSSNLPKDTTIDDTDIGSGETFGLNEFEIPLGPQKSIDSIVVELSESLLSVHAKRLSTHKGGRPRRFHIYGSIRLSQGDLGAYPELFYSSNGLLDDSESGSGWKAEKVKINVNVMNSEDGSVEGNIYIDNEPVNNPIGGG